MDSASGKSLENISEPKQNPKPELSYVETGEKVEELITKIRFAQEKLEKSLFYAEFMEQMKDPEMVVRIEKVIGRGPRNSKLQVVLYGLGKIEPVEGQTAERIHMQLAFAILLRERFEWVSDIVVFDPQLTAAERKAINVLDCTCLSFNENARRTVERPTLFFMPRCPFYLYDNVLDANWSRANLKHIIILGNSFNGHKELQSLDLTKRLKDVLDNDHMLREIPLPETATEPARPNYSINIVNDGSTSPERERVRSIDPDPVYMNAFEGLSWHFFDRKAYHDLSSYLFDLKNLIF